MLLNATAFWMISNREFREHEGMKRDVAAMGTFQEKWHKNRKEVNLVIAQNSLTSWMISYRGMS
jgi:hypothetical protein